MGVCVFVQAHMFHLLLCTWEGVDIMCVSSYHIRACITFGQLGDADSKNLFEKNWIVIATTGLESQFENNDSANI